MFNLHFAQALEDNAHPPGPFRAVQQAVFSDGIHDIHHFIQRDQLVNTCREISEATMALDVPDAFRFWHGYSQGPPTGHQTRPNMFISTVRRHLYIVPVFRPSTRQQQRRHCGDNADFGLTSADGTGNSCVSMAKMANGRTGERVRR